ncbi:MAG: hypothetical protein US25_C0017G0011 [Candidatus Moranbacteria bacterium GW2011_GWE1_36_7]|nr:MAG: hypothetical protein UR99_C0025G0011 [Candidatus Moranbacteria bacterium GW2011_GWD2_36_12]KKQ06061.1 MAG: hypothetical protein US16_C0026G0011 [Candidatus Moranbacteria bacterium GW2011_GWE2_36_40]KKQ14913.1 MAG: hypothetical protein US25_C0017G0011 [Candidatus Moranbacteria bacterium GW2011_GWE1_36_7]
MTFCDIGTSSDKNFLLRSLVVIFENLECRKNAALPDTLFFSHFDFQLTPTLSILRGRETSTKIQRRCRSGWTVVRSPSHCNQNWWFAPQSVSKVVADSESLSDSFVLQAQFFRSFFYAVAVTTKFSCAGAFAAAPTASVGARRHQRHLLGKFLFGMRDSNSQMLNCASVLIHEIVKTCDSLQARGKLPSKLNSSTNLQQMAYLKQENKFCTACLAYRAILFDF